MDEYSLKDFDKLNLLKKVEFYKDFDIRRKSPQFLIQRISDYILSLDRELSHSEILSLVKSNLYLKIEPFIVNKILSQESIKNHCVYFNSFCTLLKLLELKDITFPNNLEYPLIDYVCTHYSENSLPQDGLLMEFLLYICLRESFYCKKTSINLSPRLPLDLESMILQSRSKMLFNSYTESINRIKQKRNEESFS